jgi:hypothetical protein
MCQDEWAVCKVFHKNNGEDKKPAAVECSAGTPNVSSISVDGTGNEFLDSMINPVYFNSTSSLPDTTTTTMAPPYNAAAMTNVIGSFVDLPNYTFNDTTSGGNLQHQAAAITNSTIPTSSSDSSSWNLLHANYAMGGYNLHHQAVMARALQAIISPNSSGGLPSSSVNGILQQDTLVRNYGGTRATNHLTSSASATATVTGQVAKNLGA